MKFDTLKFKDGPYFKDCQCTIEDHIDRMFMIKMTLTEMDIYQTGHYMQLQKKLLELLNQKEETGGLMRLAIKRLK